MSDGLRDYHHQETLNKASQDHLDFKNRMKAAEDKKKEAFSKAQAYLAQTGKRDKGFDDILREGGTNNGEFQRGLQTTMKKRQEDHKQYRKKRANAYRASRDEQATYRKMHKLDLERKVDQSDYYKQKMKDEGSYGGSAENQEAIKRLISTGQKFTTLDVEREKGQASNHDRAGLYKAYGGYQNYMDNHSVNSGNWQSRNSQDEIMSMKEADDKQRNYFKSWTNFYDNKDYQQRYGDYDFAQRDRERFDAQKERFTTEFDRRDRDMPGSQYGASLGWSKPNYK